MHLNILAVVQAGQIKEDDDWMPPMIQNIDPADAHAIAKWLALATGQRAHLRLMGPAGVEDIEYTAAELLDELNASRPAGPSPATTR